jgi:hypothetical protein
MEGFFVEYASTIYIIWLAILGIRILLNSYIFIELGYELFSSKSNRDAALLFGIFTFRITDEAEKFSLIRIIKITNWIHIIFILYSLFAFLVLLFTYGK